ncbi:MAG: IS5 family transposase [Candidatus Thorarchaeota archaeon]
MSQLSFVSLLLKDVKIRAQKFLDEMDKIIPWQKLINIIEPYYPKAGNGRPPMNLLLMIKIHCLQQWYNLSDPGMEEAVYDRLSFQKFLGLDLFEDKVPDETTILNFRHLLEEHDLSEIIFSSISDYLNEKGLFMKKGTIVDATIVSSPSSTKNKKKKRDPEMSSTKKSGQFYFGMKVHTGVDSKSGIIHSLVVTTAKTHDKKMLPSLLHGKEEAVFGDKAYSSDEDKHWARDAEVYWGILDKKKRHNELSSKQIKRNRKLASIRSKVEFPFLIMKKLWGHKKSRYRDIRKNSNQWHMLAALSNLYIVRKKLRAMA